MNKQTAEGFTGSAGTPPLPPPPDGAAAADGGKPRRAARFDLGLPLRGPVPDPNALPKFLIGSFMVLLIPLLGFGLIALSGYLLRTARRDCAARSIRWRSGPTSGESCWTDSG